MEMGLHLKLFSGKDLTPCHKQFAAHLIDFQLPHFIPIDFLIPKEFGSVKRE